MFLLPVVVASHTNTTPHALWILQPPQLRAYLWPDLKGLIWADHSVCRAALNPYKTIFFSLLSEQAPSINSSPVFHLYFGSAQTRCNSDIYRANPCGICILTSFWPSIAIRSRSARVAATILLFSSTTIQFSWWPHTVSVHFSKSPLNTQCKHWSLIPPSVSRSPTGENRCNITLPDIL